MIKIEMHFLPDVYVQCDVCKGRRYNRETLEISFRGKSIADVLEMTVAEGADFFGAVPAIRDKLQTMQKVGLGYVAVGQAATTLSGGEAQRIKLSRELSRRATGQTLYILDEPTTGLHFEDIRRLLDVLHTLVEAGNTVVVIEHNLEIIKTADWIIDLGPGGGDAGGRIVAAGDAGGGRGGGGELHWVLCGPAPRPGGRQDALQADAGQSRSDTTSARVRRPYPSSQVGVSGLTKRLNSRIVCICGRMRGTAGGWVMDIRGFQVWLSAARGLTRAQRREALAVLSGRSEGAASKAAIELGVDEARRCPHCSSEGAVSRGMARGLRRYQCKGCGRTFNALSGTPLSGLHHKERWLSFGASLAKGETVKASAARCDVAVSTAFRWRHRFLAAARSDSEVLKGIVEADETYVLESRKGARGLGRKARRRGGKAKKRGLSREHVPVLMAADRSGTTVSAVLPRVDAAALTAALDPVVAKDALLVSDGGASYPPPLAPPRSG